MFEVAIPTRNRSALVQRFLGSLSRYLDRYGYGCKVYLADDSDREDEVQANAAALGSFEGPKRQTIHLTEKTRRGLVRELGRAANLSTCEFALCPKTEGIVRTGSNRNLLMLATIGRPILFVDDDTTFDTVRLGSWAQPTLSKEPDPSQLRFFDDFEALWRAIEFESVDVFEAHRRLLGQTVERPPARGKQRRPVRVAATTAGLAGDCGADFAHNYVLRGFPSLLERYSIRRESRALLRGVDRPRVSRGFHVMTAHLGLHNDGRVPPFPPFGRGQDELWGSS